eukprot:TRINITY_DN643_c0_g2_i2.p1 TRINITY_DN643_c0_g2~~TRINITY_DN643_c0_g2_i2.p1  ORF type:complete len:308 (+),score=47.83 TRINITY_DN643_c0_g2_i2:566-1489(+)
MVTIAYSIVIHHRIDGITQWFEMAHDPDNFYMIHVDAKSTDAFYQSVVELASKYSNVKLNPERYHTTYNGWSILWNHLSNFLRIIQLGETRDYFINVAGMELPIVTRRELRYFLGEHEPLSFLKEYCAYQEIRTFWVDWTWAEVKAGMVVVSKEKRLRPPGVQLHFGSQHSILHHSLVKWMLDDLRMLHLTFWLRNTKVPEDIFFITAARNSPFKHLIFNLNNLKYVKFENCCLPSCVSGLCDWEEIESSAILFLARVDSGIDGQIIEKVKRDVSQREMLEVNTRTVRRIPLVGGQVMSPTFINVTF